MVAIKNLGIWNTKSKQKGTHYLSIQVIYYIDGEEVKRNYPCFENKKKEIRYDYRTPDIEPAKVDNHKFASEVIGIEMNRVDGCYDCFINLKIDDKKHEFYEMAYMNKFKTASKHPDFKIKDKDLDGDKKFLEFMQIDTVNKNAIRNTFESAMSDINKDAEIISSEIETEQKSLKERDADLLSDDEDDIPEQEKDDSEYPF